MPSIHTKKVLLAAIALMLALSVPILCFVAFYFVMTTFAFITKQGLSIMSPLLLLGVLSGVMASTLIIAKSIRTNAIRVPISWLLITAFFGCLCGGVFEYQIHLAPNPVWSLFYGTLEIPTFTMLFIAYVQMKFRFIPASA